MVKILSFDPSGNFDEGKGTTGFSISLDDNLPHKLADIKADDYATKQEYWYAHEDLIRATEPDVLVIESYKLFGHKAKQQAGSEIPTAQLIGYLEMVAWFNRIIVEFQDPSTKQRHTDEILVKLGVIEKKGRHYYYRGELTNLHQRDALRHDMFYKRRKKLAKTK